MRDDDGEGCAGGEFAVMHRVLAVGHVMEASHIPVETRCFFELLR